MVLTYNYDEDRPGKGEKKNKHKKTQKNTKHKAQKHKHKSPITMMRTGLGKVRPSIVLKHFQYDEINAYMTKFHATLNFEHIDVVQIF